MWNANFPSIIICEFHSKGINLSVFIVMKIDILVEIACALRTSAHGVVDANLGVSGQPVHGAGQPLVFVCPFALDICADPAIQRRIPIRRIRRLVIIPFPQPGSGVNSRRPDHPGRWLAIPV